MKAVAALAAAAVVLLAVELGMGAWSFGEVRAVNPCTAHTPSLGSGFDATLQRVVLDGLNGAACRLHTTREKLVLSLSPSSGEHLDWSPETIQRAVRSGLVQAIDEAQRRGDVPGLVADVLRVAAEHAPVRFLVEGGTNLSGFFGGLLKGITG